MVGIAVVLPCGDFLDEGLFIGNPTVEALGREDAEFGLCQIKPTTVLWSVVILTPIQIDSLHDACVDTLKNDAPAIEEFAAEQGCGPYLVVIRGVAGAYFVEAADHDDSGFFSELDEARSRLHFDFGEFVIKSDD